MFNTTTTKEEFVKLYEPEIEAMNCENIVGIDVSGDDYSICVPATKDSLNNAFLFYKRMPKQIFRPDPKNPKELLKFESLNEAKEWIDAQVHLRHNAILKSEIFRESPYFDYVCISYTVLLNLVYKIKIIAHEVRYIR